MHIVRMHSLLGYWKERCTLHLSATITCNCHTMVLSTHIQMLNCWACAIIPVEFDCRKAAVVLTRTTIHYVTEVWARPNEPLLHACAFSPLFEEQPSLRYTESVLRWSHSPNACFYTLSALRNKRCLLPCVWIAPSRTRAGDFQLLM